MKTSTYLCLCILNFHCINTDFQVKWRHPHTFVFVSSIFTVSTLIFKSNEDIHIPLSLYLQFSLYQHWFSSQMKTSTYLCLCIFNFHCINTDFQVKWRHPHTFVFVSSIFTVSTLIFKSNEDIHIPLSLYLQFSLYQHWFSSQMKTSTYLCLCIFNFHCINTDFQVKWRHPHTFVFVSSIFTVSTLIFKSNEDIHIPLSLYLQFSLYQHWFSSQMKTSTYLCLCIFNFHCINTDFQVKWRHPHTFVFVSSIFTVSTLIFKSNEDIHVPLSLYLQFSLYQHWFSSQMKTSTYLCLCIFNFYCINTDFQVHFPQLASLVSSFTLFDVISKLIKTTEYQHQFHKTTITYYYL